MMKVRSTGRQAKGEGWRTRGLSEPLIGMLLASVQRLASHS